MNMTLTDAERKLVSYNTIVFTTINSIEKKKVLTFFFLFQKLYLEKFEILLLNSFKEEKKILFFKKISNYTRFFKITVHNC